MEPLTIRPKKVWARDKYRSLYVDNEKTAKRGRPRRKKTERPPCDHPDGFKFKRTQLGMKRTCKTCGRSFTEVAKR